MKQALNQLTKNNTWILMLKNVIEPSYQARGGKWVSKIK